MKCNTCKNKMTLLLTNYVCDYCDGLVEDKEKKEEDGCNSNPLYVCGCKHCIDEYLNRTSVSVDNIEWTWEEEEKIVLGSD